MFRVSDDIAWLYTFHIETMKFHIHTPTSRYLYPLTETETFAINIIMALYSLETVSIDIADFKSTFYVITLRRGRTCPRTRPCEQLLLQNYKA